MWGEWLQNQISGLFLQVQVESAVWGEFIRIVDVLSAFLKYRLFSSKVKQVILAIWNASINKLD